MKVKLDKSSIPIDHPDLIPYRKYIDMWIHAVETRIPVSVEDTIVQTYCYISSPNEYPTMDYCEIKFHFALIDTTSKRKCTYGLLSTVPKSADEDSHLTACRNTYLNSELRDLDEIILKIVAFATSNAIDRVDRICVPYD